jgi:hypothetical protein
VPPAALITGAEPTTRFLLDDMLTLLSRRPATADDPRLKRRYARQYLLFGRLLDLLQQGFIQSEALDSLAETLSVSTKTIQREITDMREFFQREGVWT